MIRSTLMGLALLAAAPAAVLAAEPAAVTAADRTLGSADAPVTVIEYFSLTCPHCAAFHRETWPQVKEKLVATGTVKMVWRDFPLDQLALAAACAARALPVDRYEGFVSALFANQDRWAFARGIDHKTEIGKIAALAGMSSATFEAAWADGETARAIFELAQQLGRQYNLQATPTFVFGTRVVSGSIAFDRFAQEAARG